MSNTRTIQPIQIWTTSGIKTATMFSLSNFFDYHFDNGSGKAKYILIGMESQGTTTDENGDTVVLPDHAVEYFSDVIEIPASVIQQWGVSDDIIFNYVATTLNLTIIP